MCFQNHRPCGQTARKRGNMWVWHLFGFCFFSPHCLIVSPSYLRLHEVFSCFLMHWSFPSLPAPPQLSLCGGAVWNYHYLSCSSPTPPLSLPPTARLSHNRGRRLISERKQRDGFPKDSSLRSPVGLQIHANTIRVGLVLAERLNVLLQDSGGSDLQGSQILLTLLIFRFLINNTSYIFCLYQPLHPPCAHR